VTDAFSAKLRDPDLLAMVAATREDCAQHLRNALTIAAGIREALDDLSPELALDLAHLERRILMALIADSQTVKLNSEAVAAWDPYGLNGPRLVVDDGLCADPEC